METNVMVGVVRATWERSRGQNPNRSPDQVWLEFYETISSKNPKYAARTEHETFDSNSFNWL